MSGGRRLPGCHSAPLPRGFPPDGAERFGGERDGSTQEDDVLEQEAVRRVHGRKGAGCREKERDRADEGGDRERAADDRRTGGDRADGEERGRDQLGSSDDPGDAFVGEERVEPAHERAVGDERLDCGGLGGGEFEGAEENEDEDERVAQHADPDGFEGGAAVGGGGRKSGSKLDTGAHDESSWDWKGRQFVLLRSRKVRKRYAGVTSGCVSGLDRRYRRSVRRLPWMRTRSSSARGKRPYRSR